MIEKLIDKFAKQFRIETEIVEDGDTVNLITYSYLGSKLLYTHSLDLSPLLDIAEARRTMPTDADAP